MQKYTLNLGGTWRLSGRRESGVEVELRHFGTAEFTIQAEVPGNIELALQNAGMIPDPYVKLNAQALRPYEFYEWLYEYDFEYDGVKRNINLVFEGLDCCARILLNGQEVGRSENAMIIHRFSVGNQLQPGKNTIAVHLLSANNVFRNAPMNALTITGYPYNYESTRIRKPAHVWGWDITPRMALGGIFRAVRLEELCPNRLIDGFLQISKFDPKVLTMLYHYHIATSSPDFQDLRIIVEGVSGESRWSASEAVWSAQGVLRFTINNPRLWWPRHYGNPNLYTVTVRLMHQEEVLFEEQFTYGLRQIKLKALPVWTDAETPDFQFIVNDVPIRIFGCNHVPADALHSRDPERLPKILDMACDLNCNMLRLWGGGIYESDCFYDRCDREGILIWHDFMMGCAIYPADAEFKGALRQEAEAVVKRLRRHPSIALWAGDNECDCCACFWGVSTNPNLNVLTREILPDVCRYNDPSRPFLPSSPWYSPEAVAKTPEGQDPMFFASEQHLWGPRDYFKSDFYRNTKASFVSEIGYHGCPNISSIQRFVSADKVWPWYDNEEWDYHASNPFLVDNKSLNYRTKLMADQIKEMFGVIPESMDDFVRASQFCQAEAKKYFIELIRSKSKMSGLLWWNLIDCWPQFSDAIVDYYFGKKLAYYFIRRIQHPFAIVLPEPDSWNQRVMAANDFLEVSKGSYRIWDAESGAEFNSGSFEVAPRTVAMLDMAKVCTTEQRLLLIEWTLESGVRGVNHAVCGHPQFDLRRALDCWLPAIASLDGSFQAEQIGR